MAEQHKDEDWFVAEHWASRISFQAAANDDDINDIEMSVILATGKYPPHYPIM